MASALEGSLPAKTRKDSPVRRLWANLAEGLLWLLLLTVALIEIAPISWMFSTSLRDPKRSFDL
ncbi:MAG TPA: hypothetical protein PL105_25460, partial [Caldilineaceae bacterium]|nr:hypothetical protein [Caldilineaceae bacterium]